MKKTAKEDTGTPREAPARQKELTATQAPKPPETKAQPKEGEAKPEKTEEQQKMMATLKDIENALFALKFYPVAVKEQAKDEAMAKLMDIYAKGNETVRQMLLYMIHEVLATSAELKIMHTLDYFKMKNPGVDPSQLRVNVYRAIFNYNTSLEGLTEIIRLLGRFKGSDDAIKVLTYHFAHLASTENEAHHILRGAILETLGESESKYAFYALLDYAHYTDNERTFNRVVSALTKWEDRLEKLDVPKQRKDELREKIKEIITSDFGGSHYR
ncbi:hypothetical protein H0O00_00675 [Candidatus Micrarchaeota archaeon]|nr:hypothetical protein [Candidatus Micrarchaeota archaeon]